VGDAGVREVDVVGPHRVRRDGDVLVVEQVLDDAEEADGHAFAFVIDGRQRHVDLGRAFRHGRRHPLAIRANPDAALEVACSAGSVSISGMRSAIDLDVSAGSVRLDDLRGPLTARINAGSLRARGQLTSGSSRVECDAGSVRLFLDPASSVRVAVETHLGRSEVRTNRPQPVDRTARGLDGGRREFVLGEGERELEVVVNMGSVKIDAT
jgi:hypothetical protein